MPRYVAVDIGSNSTRMLAAEVNGGSAPVVLAQDREVTRLGTSVFRSGTVSPEAMERVSAVLKRFADTYQKLGVAAVRAVATSAVRDAGNQHEFIERASAAVGAPVEIISGQEEARLIHLGVQAVWPHRNKRILIVDVGGGSAEIIAGEDMALSGAFSKPLGAVRLKEVFLSDDPPTDTQLARMNAYIDEKLSSVHERLGRKKYDRVIATSATAAAVVSAVNQISRTKRDQADRMRATTRQIRQLFGELTAMSLSKRQKHPGIGPRRAEIIVPGTAVLLRVLETFGLPSLYYSRAGVRDGIVADLASRHAGGELSRLDSERRRAVQEMARRFGVDVRHGKKVAQLANQLFVATFPLHGLPPSAGKILEAASYLHDTGHYVSSMGHHKHSAYLIANADLPGFTDHEKRLIAFLCRFHRKSMPAARHVGFNALLPEDRKVVLNLIPLLRIADSLDRGHEQKVEQVQLSLRANDVVLTLSSSGDANLEEWASERVSGVFRQVYSKNLQVEQIRL